jgi:hypothetical protein
MGKKRDKSQRTRTLKPAYEKQATTQRAQERRVAAKGARRGATDASRAFMDTFVRPPGVILQQEQFGNDCLAAAAVVLPHEEGANEPSAASMNASNDQHDDPEYDDASLYEDSSTDDSSTDDSYTPSDDNDSFDDDVEPRRWCPEMEKTQGQPSKGTRTAK